MRVPDRHGGVLRWIRAVIFIAAMYLLLLFMGLACLIPSKMSRNWSMIFIHAYCDAVMWMLRVIVGTRVEVRGTVPDQPCIVASKHQSFLDIIILTRALPKPAFVMKKSLRWTPVLGVYAERLGSIAIDRSSGGQAVQAMLKGASQQAAGRQIIIFPQGTRLHPAKELPYRPGVLKLYHQLQQPIQMVALNTGWFWPRTGLRRTPGVVVVEFLGTIPAGGQPDVAAFAEPIEAASQRLAVESEAALANDPSMPPLGAVES